MANIATTVWDFLKLNSNAIGNATLLNDGSKLIEDIYSELTKPGAPDWVKLTNDFTSLATGVITELTNNSAAGNAIAIRAAAVKLNTDAGQFALGTTSFADVVQSFGGLIEAIGLGMQIPTLNSIGLRVEVAGIMIGAYGALLGRANQLGSYLGIQTYDWWQSVTQTDTKREAEIYATGLARSLDPAFTEATARAFIDGSKSNDTGIGESVEYIKSIRKLLGLGDVFTAATANDVYEAAQETRAAIQTLFGDSQFEISVPGNARTDLSAFLSLYYLVPFSIKPTDAGALNTLYNLHATIADQWNADRNLTAEQIANGEANFSDQYLADRAAMLGWVLKSNLDDTSGRADGLNAIYVDIASGTNLSPIIVSNTPKYIFGSNNADTGVTAIAGGTKADHLYGMGGNDTINGGNGNDYIEGGADDDTLNGGEDADQLYGGAGQDTLNGGEGNDILIGGTEVDILDGGTGNDQLKGGAGVDVYQFTGSNYGTDTITDTDGQGVIMIGSNPQLSGGTLKASNLWESADHKTRYSIYTNPDNTQTLNIILEDGKKIFVKNWVNGQLNIQLQDAPIVTPNTPTNGTSADDYLIAAGNTLDGLAGNDVMVGSAADDTLRGDIGADILFGNQGDDTLESSAMRVSIELFSTTNQTYKKPCHAAHALS